VGDEHEYTNPGDDAGDPGTASWPQSIPDKTGEGPFGDPTIRYLLEKHGGNNTGAYTGVGHRRNSPGREQVGSSGFPGQEGNGPFK
jgi:hypothetical protein